MITEEKLGKILAFFLEFFSGGTKSIVMLLFSDQISRRGKSFQGGKLPQGAPPAPCGRKPELQLLDETISLPEPKFLIMWNCVNNISCKKVYY